MIKNWVVQMVLSFVMRQIGKWGSSVDWTKVKADIGKRVADLVPGTWFDAEAVAVAHAVIDAVAAALRTTDALEAIVKLVMAEKFQEAWQALRKLIMDSWVPVTAAEKTALACIEGCESIA